MQNLDEGSARCPQFTVPAGAGAYAVEELFLKVAETDTAKGLYRKIRQLRILIETLVATAVVEVWALRHGGDESNAAHWFNTGLSANALGLGALMELGCLTKCKLRTKSGGTAGNMAVSAFWA